MATFEAMRAADREEGPPPAPTKAPPAGAGAGDPPHIGGGPIGHPVAPVKSEPTEPPTTPAAAHVEGAEETFLVDRILGHKVVGGIAQVHCLWEPVGDAPQEATWEPIENLPANKELGAYFKSLSAPNSKPPAEGPPPSKPAPPPPPPQAPPVPASQVWLANALQLPPDAADAPVPAQNLADTAAMLEAYASSREAKAPGAHELE